MHVYDPETAQLTTENYFPFIDVRIKNLIPNILQLLLYPLSCRVVNDTTKQPRNY